MQNRLKLFVVTLLLIFLAGCSSCPCCGDGKQVADDCVDTSVNPCNPCIRGTPVPPACPNPQACTVQICKEPIVCTIPERNRRIAYLTAHGVKVIQVGETITLILPSDKVFYPDSANINPCFIPILKVASDYVFCFEKMTVKINAYGDNLCSPYRTLILTQAQAQAIAKTFWCNGIDTRLLVAQGYGCGLPIGANASCAGREQNRRVEICFRYIPPYAPSC